MAVAVMIVTPDFQLLSMTLNYSAFDAKRALKKGAPLPVYGVWGDSYLCNRVVASLLEWSLDADARDFNLDTLDGESAKISDVLAATGNLPFLSERRVVLVRRAEKLEGLAREEGGAAKKKKSTDVSPAKRLGEGIEKLPPSTVLILARTPETPEPGDRPGERCLNAALDKIIDGRGLLINCLIPPKNTGVAVAIVENEAAAKDIPLARGAAAHLVERCGTDIAALLSELEKCALRAGVGEAVTAPVIDEMTKRALSETVFDLTDAIGARAGARALGNLRELLGAGEPPELVMSLIVRHLRQLMQARALLDAGLSLDASAARRISPALMAQLPQGRDNLASALQTQGWMGGRLSAQARHFSGAQLSRALELAFEADLAAKGIEGNGGFESRDESKASLEILVAKLCAL